MQLTPPFEYVANTLLKIQTHTHTETRTIHNVDDDLLEQLVLGINFR